MDSRCGGALRTLWAAAITAALIVCGYQTSVANERWDGVIVTANEKAHSLSIVRPGTPPEIQTIALGVAPHNVQTSADGRFVYATGATEMDMSGDMAHMKMDMPGFLLAFDLQHPGARPVLAVRIGDHPAHVVVDSANRFAYVTVANEDVVKVVDLAEKRIVDVIPVGKMPHGLRMSSDGTRLYIADMQGDAVSIVDVAARKEIARVPAGKQPVQVGISPDGKRVYATLGGDNAVAVIDTSTHRSIGRIPVGRNPAQLFVSPDGARVYVANQGTAALPDRTVSVIDTRSLRVIGTIEVGAGAHGVVVTPDNARVFVTDAFAGRLAEIDAATLAVRTYGVGAGPNGVTLGSR